jgi:hypothetical protein
LSKSVRASATIAIAVCCTIPSVGRYFVGRGKYFSPAPSACPLAGAARFTTQSFVATLLVTVRIGFTPAGNSAVTIPIPSALLSTVFAVPPSHWNVLASVFW